MKLKIAQISDIEKVLELHSKYQIDGIKEEDKKDGFVTTAFTKEQLTKLINEEQGLFIAIKDEQVVAYVMSASWQFWSVWPMFAHMIKDLPNLTYLGQTLSVDNSYQYGPVCVDKSVRGTGILEAIFDMPEMNAIRNLLIYEYITPSIQHGLDTETVVKLAHKWMTERHLPETVIDWVVKDFKGKL